MSLYDPFTEKANFITACLPLYKWLLLTFLFSYEDDQFKEKHCTVYDIGICTKCPIKNKAQHHECMNDAAYVDSGGVWRLEMKISRLPPYNTIHFSVVIMVISMQNSNLTAAPQTQALNPVCTLLVLNVFMLLLQCVTKISALQLGL